MPWARLLRSRRDSGQGRFEGPAFPGLGVDCGAEGLGTEERPAGGAVCQLSLPIQARAKVGLSFSVPRA